MTESSKKNLKIKPKATSSGLKSDQSKNATTVLTTSKLQHKSDTGGFFSQKSFQRSKHDSAHIELDEVLVKQKTDAFAELMSKEEVADDPSDMVSPKEYETKNR